MEFDQIEQNFINDSLAIDYYSAKASHCELPAVMHEMTPDRERQAVPLAGMNCCNRCREAL